MFRPRGAPRLRQCRVPRSWWLGGRPLTPPWDLGIHNNNPNVKQFPRNHQEPGATTVRQSHSRTLLPCSPPQFPQRDVCPSLLANFPAGIIGFLFLLASPVQDLLHVCWLSIPSSMAERLYLSQWYARRWLEQWGQRDFVRLCRLLPDERPCPSNIGFYYLFKGCFHDTAISNPAWRGRKIIVGLFGRMCFIWHVWGMAVQRQKIKLRCLWQPGSLSVGNHSPQITALLVPTHDILRCELLKRGS